ncbi:hypothetical protein MNV49_004055 [Pseudohyphozyma bogoriensis]|nr:hypothetical protein MNV49_004055 [Pseudohyphozyma bogoriensis]
MPIAPIQGQLRRSAIKHISIGIASGIAGGYGFWYGIRMPAGRTCTLSFIRDMRDADLTLTLNHVFPVHARDKHYEELAAAKN